MKYGKIFTYETRNEAEIGKRYVFSDLYNDIYKNPETRVHSGLKAVNDTSYPFMNCHGGTFQLIREVFEEPVLMTHRQLAEWLAKGNGQMKFEDTVANSVVYPYHVYNLEKENDAVEGFVRIRSWDSDEWVVPTVDIYERDCR